MKQSVKVAIIEDHPEYREMVALLLEDEDEIALEWQFGSAEWALRRLSSDQRKKLPDVILLDLGLPGMSGHVAIPALKEVAPAAKIIILSQAAQEEAVIEAISLGVSGYLLKSATAAQIVRAIREVVEGGHPLDAHIAGFILKNLPAVLVSGDQTKALTDREIEVLELVASGLVKKEIANNLGIGETTVISHVKNIYEKLGAVNAPAAVAKAYRVGLLPRGRRKK